MGREFKTWADKNGIFLLLLPGKVERTERPTEILEAFVVTWHKTESMKPCLVEQATARRHEQALVAGAEDSTECVISKADEIPAL